MSPNLFAHITWRFFGATKPKGTSWRGRLWWCAAMGIWGASVSQALAQPRPKDVRSVGCWTMVDDRLLVVRDVWSGRYSLPQSQARQAETLAQTAERAVQERTVLQVEATGHVMWHAHGMMALVCSVTSGKALAQVDHVALSHEGRRGLIEARLFDAAQLKQARFRNEAEGALVQAHLGALKDDGLPHATYQQTRTVLGRLLRAQLRGVHWLQRHQSIVLPRPGFWPEGLGHATLWAMALGAVVWTTTRWRQGAELVLFALVAALIGCVLKDVCALPRPFHLDASLTSGHTSGYSFPSGMTLVVTAVVGLLLRQTRRHAWAWMAAAVCFFCGLVCVCLGRNFMHDVLGAWVLGSALVLGYETVLRRANLAYLPLRAWAVVGLGVGAVAIGLRPLPWPTEAMGLLVGLCLGLPWCRGATQTLSFRMRFGLCGVMLLALVLLAFLGQHAQVVAKSPLGATFGRTLTAVGMGLVLPIMHRLAHGLGPRLAR